MAYTIIEQKCRDLDWFVFDVATRRCLHFASAGGILPRAIAEQSENNEHIMNKARNTIAPFKHEYKINPNLSSITGIKSDSIEYKEYIKDFIKFAEQGFYSFDRTNINNCEDQLYHLVAWPANKNKTKKKSIFRSIGIMSAAFNIKDLAPEIRPSQSANSPFAIEPFRIIND